MSHVTSIRIRSLKLVTLCLVSYVLATIGVFHSTVTDFARFRGWSTSQPRLEAM